MTQTGFYLGRLLSSPNAAEPKDALYYDPNDLLTHAIVTGMTGSGKTGLCIGLLEEAALQEIPAIVIDPKGDLTNLLLHFPDLAPQDFRPWIDAESARRRGITLEKAAEETARLWREGLAKWDISPDRILALKNAAQFAIYTPGSDAGIPVSVLTSMESPSLPWEGNREILRERIGSAVTALLGLVGFDEIDPIRSREHILLANIFEQAWSQNRPLDLTELILQTQTPPFEKLGAFPLESFFPAKDRMDLAIRLNNILAAPAFEIWREGQPLDIPALLYTSEGRPRHSVFYLAHLSETERMFFVTLLFSAIETWMRSQAGSSTLRALIYMDEIYGYLPPQKTPPSKAPLLRMLKQARAYGVGFLLATQNPVDVDYKALSNAGTWFIGKLQTEQDKARLLDGLETASGSLDRRALNQEISKLGKRAFLLHNVHETSHQFFRTRWAMNYLAGPLTRAQIPALNKLVGADSPPPTRPSAPKRTASLSDFQPVPAPSAKSAPKADSAAPSLPGSRTRPALPSSVGEYFLPLNLSIVEAFDAAKKPISETARQIGILYRPALVAAAQVRFLQAKYNVDTKVARAALVPNEELRGILQWEDFFLPLQPESLGETPAPQARFASPKPPLTKARQLSSYKRDFADYLYRTLTISARRNAALKIYAGPEISSAEFMRRCSEAARAARDEEIEKTTEKYQRKIRTLENRLKREERELEQDREELSERKWEELGTHAENLLGMGRSRRRLSTSLTKHRLTQQAKADVEESLDAIEDYQNQIEALKAELNDALEEIRDKWGETVNDIEEISITPKKADIFIAAFGVGWVPYYLLQEGEEIFEIPAYGVKG